MSCISDLAISVHYIYIREIASPFLETDVCHSCNKGEFETDLTPKEDDHTPNELVGQLSQQSQGVVVIGEGRVTPPPSQNYFRSHIPVEKI